MNLSVNTVIHRGDLVSISLIHTCDFKLTPPPSTGCNVSVEAIGYSDLASPGLIRKGGHAYFATSGD